MMKLCWEAVRLVGVKTTRVKVKESEEVSGVSRK